MRLGLLAEAQGKTELELQLLSHQLARLTDDVGRLKGTDLESRFIRRAAAYLGRQLRRTHVLTAEELVELLDDAEDRGVLSDQERGEVLLADAVVRGRRRSDRREVYLVTEVSWGVGVSDVDRAAQRAAFLARCGVEAIALVAGESITAEAASMAPSLGVETLLLRTTDHDSPFAA